MKKMLIVFTALIFTITGCTSTVLPEIAKGNTTSEEDTENKNVIFDTEGQEAKRAEEVFPQSFNWLDYNVIVTPQDQGDLGTCAIYAATSAFESYIALSTGELVNLSEQQYVMSVDSWSPDAGLNPESVFNFYRENGVITDDQLPYSIEDALNKTESKDYGYDYKLDAAIGCEPLDGKSLEDRIHLIKAKVLNNGPIVTAITYYADFKNYTDGIYEYDGTSKALGGHWINIIGWQDDDSIKSGGYWICKNSFGSDWGKDGFCKIAYDDFCGVDSFVIYFINAPIN